MACPLLLPCEIHWYELGLNPRVAKFVNRERGLAVGTFDFVHFFGNCGLIGESETFAKPKN